MKLQCELCREIVPADFALAAAGIDVHCPACGKSFIVAPTRGAAVDLQRLRAARRSAPPTDAMTCTSAATSSPSAAPAAPGLVADRMAEFAQ